MTKSTIPISSDLAAAYEAADRAAIDYGAAAGNYGAAIYAAKAADDRAVKASAALATALATAEAASISYHNALAAVERAYNSK